MILSWVSQLCNFPSLVFGMRSKVVQSASWRWPPTLIMTLVLQPASVVLWPALSGESSSFEHLLLGLNDVKCKELMSVKTADALAVLIMVRCGVTGLAVSSLAGSQLVCSAAGTTEELVAGCRRECCVLRLLRVSNLIKSRCLAIWSKLEDGSETLKEEKLLSNLNVGDNNCSS